MSIIIKGADAINRNLEKIAHNLPDELEKALFQEAQIEATESRKRTPVLTGALKGSHEVEKPVWKGRDVSVTIKVGGPAAFYAIPVHYDLEAIHTTGQALFLESTIMESRPAMARRVAKRIDLNRLL